MSAIEYKHLRLRVNKDQVEFLDKMVAKEGFCSRPEAARFVLNTFIKYRKGLEKNASEEDMKELF